MEEVSTPEVDDTPTEFESLESSSIIGAVYDPHHETLVVTFKGGKRYGHGNIHADEWRGFYQAESKGAYYNKHIRPLSAGKLL
jgi:hypothetical protein